ncbi:hypothetical protein [Streptomyces virginiae]|uniref:hypothetical protein n=1 Tax=Streptomyces virginiae TaxID=1961 RepID=UPI002255F758|nr:hypothetical protein [Streptomyces virginiae]MCX5278104.1 hypothetical protein [Streptomyces virginiae]
MSELTDTAAVPAAAPSTGDPWLERKFADHAGAAADCRYPDCTEEREGRRPGKTGPPPEFCPNHNNKRDKQYAYRQEQKAKAEAAARHAAEEGGESAPTPDPLPVVLARRAREQSVLAEMLPRVAIALETILAGEQAAADTDAVAAHIAAVDHAAAVQVEEADTARAAAEQTAATAHTAAEASARAAAEADEERDAALREAATALREAADADQQAGAATEALRQLTKDHLALRGEHQDLQGEHRHLTERHAERVEAHASLNRQHAELTERAGRLDGELAALRPQLEKQTKRITALEDELRTTNDILGGVRERAGGLQTALEELHRTRQADAARHTEELAGARTERDDAAGKLATATTDLGVARERAEGLQRQLNDLDRDRNAERARHTQALAELRAGHEKTLAELREQLTRLTAENAALTAVPASPPAVTEAEGTGQPAQQDVSVGQMDMFTLDTAGQPVPGPAEPPHDPAEPGPQEQSPGPAGSGAPDEADELPVAIEDLGFQAGSGWCMARYPSSGDTWTVLRDGQQVGTVTPERASIGRRSLLGWSAQEQLTAVRPTKGRHFNNRDTSARAVIKASLRRQPEPATAAPAWWAALTEQTATALVRAAAPMATASATHGGHLSFFAPALRQAALRLATRAPHDGDLAQLGTVSEPVLNRSKDGARLVAALRAAAVASETTALGTVDGRVWTLEPDLEHRDVQIVCADGQPVGTLEPTAANPGGRWAATHRRRTLKPAASRAFPDRDAALQAVIAAERDHRPLPALDDPAWHRIQPGFRGTLYSAARAAMDLKNSHSQLEPIEYRRAVTNALVEARRSVNAPVEPEHLAVLLDAPREDLGPKQSARADRLYEILQRIRDDLLAR